MASHLYGKIHTNHLVMHVVPGGYDVGAAAENLGPINGHCGSLQPETTWRSSSRTEKRHGIGIVRAASNFKEAQDLIAMEQPWAVEQLQTADCGGRL